MEPRKTQNRKPNELPVDYLKMVAEVFSTHFGSVLEEAHAKGMSLVFEASGGLYANETLLTVALTQKDELGAMAIHVSTDFDPKASHPTAEELLQLSVDAAGDVLQTLLDHPQNKEALLSGVLSEIEDAPFEWTAVEVSKKRVFVRLDRTNPRIEKMTDDWLEKNDPDLKANRDSEEKETEALFVTGAPTIKDKPPTGSRH